MIYRVEFIVSAERRVVPTDLLGEVVHHLGDIRGGSAQRVSPYNVSVVVSFEADSDDDAHQQARGMRFPSRSHDLAGISVGRGRSYRVVSR